MPLDAILGGLGGLLGGILNQRAQDKRMNKMLKHLEAVEAWQRQNLATAQNAIQSSKQAFEADPRRAKVAAQWSDLLENPSALTDQMVSAQKQTALSSSARSAAEGGRMLSMDAQRRGLAGSPLEAALRGTLFSNASRSAQVLSAGIDTNAALTRRKDRERVLGGYNEWMQGDLDRAYGYNKDLASLLGNIQYQSSLGMTG